MKLEFFHMQYHMEKFTKMIVSLMKNARLYASQGGPIILSQVGFYLKQRYNLPLPCLMSSF